MSQSSSSLPSASNSAPEIFPKLLENPQKGPSAAKPLKEDKEYFVFDDGRVYSQKAKRFLKGRINDQGYVYYNMPIENPLTGKKGKIMFAHVLVAKYFLPNPNHYDYVRHKDGNTLDNSVENLQWTNDERDFKVVKEKPKYHGLDLKEEMWRVIQENPMYSVSSKGRVKNNKTNRILRLDESQKHARVRLNDKKQYYLHRLVYCTFYKDYDLDGFEIVSLDGNPKNNNIENLEKQEKKKSKRK